MAEKSKAAGRIYADAPSRRAKVSEALPPKRPERYRELKEQVTSLRALKRG